MFHSSLATLRTLVLKIVYVSLYPDSTTTYRPSHLYFILFYNKVAFMSLTLSSFHGSHTTTDNNILISRG